VSRGADTAAKEMVPATPVATAFFGAGAAEVVPTLDQLR